jgi:hypothetical protein
MSATANASKRLKAHAAARKGLAWESREPAFSIMDYMGSMMKCLNFYNQEVDSDTKKKWTLDLWKSQNKDIKGLEKVASGFFNQTGALARTIARGYDITEAHYHYLDKRYAECWSFVPEEAKEKAKAKPTIQDRISDIASKHIAEFDAALDDFCFKGTEFNAKEYLKANDIKAPTAKLISQKVKGDLAEFEEAYAGKDKDLVEGYSNFGKRGLKKVIDFLKTNIDACEAMAVIAKVLKKPRARKEKPPLVLAAKMKYLREIPELKLRSVTPDNIVGAQECWVYNTKYRKLIQYTALEGYALSVKGTKILNWDPEKSGGKTIRKPEVVLADVGSMTKRPLQKLFNEVKSVTGKANGRMTEEILIVKVF